MTVLLILSLWVFSGCLGLLWLKRDWMKEFGDLAGFPVWFCLFGPFAITTGAWCELSRWRDGRKHG